MEGAWDAIKEAWQKSLSHDEDSIGSPGSPLVVTGSPAMSDTKNKINRSVFTSMSDEDSDSDEEITYQELMERAQEQAEKKQNVTTSSPSTNSSTDDNNTQDPVTLKKQALADMKSKLQQELAAKQDALAARTTTSTAPTLATTATPPTTTTTNSTTSTTTDSPDRAKQLQDHIADEKREREKAKTNRQSAERQQLRLTPITPIATPSHTSTTTTPDNTTLLLLIGAGIALISGFLFYRMRNAKP